MHDARLRFSDSIQEIFRDLASVDLYPRETDDLRSYVRAQLKIQDAGDKLDRAIVTGVLSPEDYYRFRLRPLLGAIECEEHSLRKKTRILQLFVGICSGAAIVLGAVNDAVVYLPVAVAAATSKSSRCRTMNVALDLQRQPLVNFEVSIPSGQDSATWTSSYDLPLLRS